MDRLPRGCWMGSGEVRNEITDGVIHGPVVQAGSFSGQIHHHHPGDRGPLDLLTLRLWVERVAAGYRAQVLRTGDPAGVAHLRHLDLVLAGLAAADAPPEDRDTDVVRRLMVAGIVGYLARPGPPPDRPVPDQILLDLVVFATWPLVTARRLPADWPGRLAQLTSPRLAALVERTRAERAPAAETFARTVANRSFSPAMAALFDDLADPRRGGALLAGMAVAGGLPLPPTGAGEGRRVAAWTLAVAGGAVLAEGLRRHPATSVRILGEVLAGLPVRPGDPRNPVDLVDLVDWLLT